MVPFQHDERGRVIAFAGSFPNLGMIRLFLEQRAGQAESPYHLYDTIRLIARTPPGTPALFETLAATFAHRFPQSPVRLQTRAAPAADAAECFLTVHVDCIDDMRDMLIELLNEEEAKLAAATAAPT